MPQALTDAIKLIQLQADQYYVIHTSVRMEKIPYHNILYIEREGKNSIINLTNQTVTKVRKSLTQVVEELHSDDFIYVDRGNIVNITHIMSIKEGIVEIKNGIRIPASHAKLEQIKNKLIDFWGNQI